MEGSEKRRDDVTGPLNTAGNEAAIVETTELHNPTSTEFGVTGRTDLEGSGKETTTGPPAQPEVTEIEPSAENLRVNIKTELQNSPSNEFQVSATVDPDGFGKDGDDVNKQLVTSKIVSSSKTEENSRSNENTQLLNPLMFNGLSAIEAKIKEEAILRDIFSDGRRNRKSSNTVCEVCGYKAGRVNHLKTHMRKHTGEKPYSCGICNFRTGAVLSLQRHMRVHTGEKPYSCEVCKYRSAHLSDMKRHVSIHSGEKPHGCIECHYRCASLKEMRRHMRTHTGEKPYSCELCYYKASQKATLTAHMKVHTGEKPFSCSFCDYRARRASHVTRHMKTHSGELTRVLTSEDSGSGVYAHNAEGD